MCCFLLPNGETVDRDKCIRMALVHDLAESIVGDITPHCGVSAEEKYALEAKAMSDITRLVPPSIGHEIENLWQEFEAGLSMEAKVVKDIDRFEMLMQAYTYERDQSINLDQFFSSNRAPFNTDLFESLNSELKAKRLNMSSASKSTETAGSTT